MSWVEVDGAGLRWVHGLVIPKLLIDPFRYELTLRFRYFRFIYYVTFRYELIKINPFIYELTLEIYIPENLTWHNLLCIIALNDRAKLVTSLMSPMDLKRFTD